MGNSVNGRNDRDRNPVAALLLLIFVPLVASLIQLAISCSREFEADRMGAELAGTPYGLANALKKLDNANRRIPLPEPDAQSNMFVIAPLTIRKLTALFMTQPPTGERIRRLLVLYKT